MENLKLDGLNDDQKETVMHIAGYVMALAKSTNEFLGQIDLEDQEAVNYVRTVWQQVDNVVLAVTRSLDDEDRKEKMRKSTELRIQQMIAEDAKEKGNVH